MDEDTNGHVDNICQWVGPAKVTLAWEDNHDDPQHERSQMAYDYLSNETDAKGRPIEIVKIHVPNVVKITKEESEGVDIVEGTFPRNEGDRLLLPATSIIITAMVPSFFQLSTTRTTKMRLILFRNSSQIGLLNQSTLAKSC